MAEQLHITHRDAYQRARVRGMDDARHGRYYAPRVGDTDEQRAAGLGYEDGWAEADPCSNGTCVHLAHR